LKVAVIIPTYNERENLQFLVPKIINVFNEGGIEGGLIIIDDSSPDRTGDLARELGEHDERILVIIRKEKLGLGSAYKEGFRKALSYDFEGLIEMDADRSHDPQALPVFREKLEEGYDLIIGSRYIAGGKIPNWSLKRRLISKATSLYTRILFRLKTQDPTSGFRAYSAKALKEIDVSKIKSDGYAFQIEMVVHCEKKGLRVCEIPIKFLDRVKGESKLSGVEVLRFIKSLIRLIFEK